MEDDRPDALLSPNLQG